MQQLTTVYQNPKWLIRQPPTFKNVGDCSPNPLRIDDPARISPVANNKREQKEKTQLT